MYQSDADVHSHTCACVRVHISHTTHANTHYAGLSKSLKMPKPKRKDTSTSKGSMFGASRQSLGDSDSRGGSM